MNADRSPALDRLSSGDGARRARRFRRVAAVLAISLVAAGPAGANGWEHWSVPLEALLTMLAGDQAEYKVAAARSLGYRREQRAVPLLVKNVIVSDQPMSVAAAAIEALGRIGDGRVEPLLWRVLREDSRQDLRGEAAAALGAMGGPANLQVLRETLIGEMSLVVRGRLVDALGAFRDPAASAALAVVLDDPRSRSLRQRVIRALGLSGPAAARPLISALQAARAVGEQVAIVDALGRSGAPEAIEPLTGLQASAKDSDLRMRIAVALGAINDGGAVPTLIRMLDDPAMAAQYFAVRALGEARDKQAATPLRALFARLARRNSGVASGHMPVQADAYIADLTLQIEIVGILADIDARESFDVFARALTPREFPRDTSLGLRLNDSVFELRRAAITGFGYARTMPAVRMLAEKGMLTDRDFRLRAAAVRAIGVLGPPNAVDHLLPRLADEAPEVRSETAFVLGRLGDPKAVRPLAGHLKDDHSDVRRHAALSLGVLRAREATTTLLELAANDPSVAVRAAASVALSLLKAVR